MCFSLEWLKEILIWFVIIAAVIAILKLLVPFVIRHLGWDPASEGIVLLFQIINIVVWAAMIIFVIIVAFSLIACLLGWAPHLLR